MTISGLRKSIPVKDSIIHLTCKEVGQLVNLEELTKPIKLSLMVVALDSSIVDLLTLGSKLLRLQFTIMTGFIVPKMDMAIT